MFLARNPILLRWKLIILVKKKVKITNHTLWAKRKIVSLKNFHFPIYNITFLRDASKTTRRLKEQQNFWPNFLRARDIPKLSIFWNFDCKSFFQTLFTNFSGRTLEALCDFIWLYFCHSAVLKSLPPFGDSL